MEEVRLPELGESVEEAYVAAVLIKPGDKISIDQPLLTLETGKAVVDLPSPVAGIVKEILVKEDETIKVGHALIRVDANGTGASPTPVQVAGEQEAADDAEATGGESSEPAVDSDSRPQETSTQAPAEETARAPVDIAAIEDRKTDRQVADSATVRAPASPSVRRLAREIGVEITQVSGTGPRGRISMDDVKHHAQQAAQRGTGPGAGAVSAPLPDFSQWGETERQPLNMIRRAIADNMTRSWQTIPHVTQHDKADITEAESFRKEFGGKVEAAGGKLTMTAILLKVCAVALKTFPRFNASLDTQSREIVYKKYVHIGVAVDTENGLLVPVIRDADRKTILELAVELGQIASKARERKLDPKDMEGGNFSISNLGGIGGTSFTPIVLPPQVAVVGVSRAVTEPVHRDGDFEARLMLPLSLSYDHRVIDGADGARFLRWVCQALEQPLLLELGA